MGQNNINYTNQLTQRRLSALELIHRRKCRSDLAYWASTAVKDYTMPGLADYSPARHHQLLLRKLADVAEGRIKKLAVFMPPGSSKSTYASIIFPAWYMAKNPKAQVIGASSNSNLAEDFSRKVQALMRNHSIELGVNPINESAALWTASNASRYLSAGVGGSITGFRANLAIIDDPIKNFEDAFSEKVQNSNFNWYRTVLHTRIVPSASIVLIQTRWHQLDLAGLVLEAQPKDWTILNLPAIWDSDEPDELGRARGDLLWPEWQDKKFIDEARATLGEREFHALFQQSPRPTEGSIFKTNRIKIETAYSTGGEMVRAWDLASTAKTGTRDPDYTVGIKMLKRPDNSILILDVVRFRDGPEIVRETIKNVAQWDGIDVKISIPQDPGSAGKYVISDLTKMLIGFNVTSSPESGSKETRAMPMSAQVNAGNVSILKKDWNAAFLDELQTFPGGAHDDQVDSCSRAFFELTVLGAPPRMIDLPWMQR
jgi:predicted phage terminase large subunit-like protein